MSKNKYSVAEQVHREVNFSVNYVSDDENYGTPEYWTEAITILENSEAVILNQRPVDETKT
jgi:predicted transglutaminase-like cysteine proteinase